MTTELEDNSQTPTHREGRAPIQLKSVSILDALLNVCNSLWQFARRTLRQLSPQLVSLLVCLLAIPILVLFSSVAGWLVWKNVPKGWSIPVYLQYGDGRAPYSDLAVNKLFSNQPYDISLHLTVPASEANYGLGNFMTSLTVTDYWNNTLATVRKPSLVLPPHPSLIPFVSRTPRLLELTLPLLKNFVTGKENIYAHIDLGRNDGWQSLGRGEGRELIVYSATLYGDVHPQGLRRILSAFPLSIAIASAVTFFVVSTLILIGFLIPSIQWRVESTDEGETDEDPQSPSPVVEELPLKDENKDVEKFRPKDEYREYEIPSASSSIKSEHEPELRLRSRKRSSDPAVP